jgi:hypothetical protein
LSVTKIRTVVIVPSPDIRAFTPVCAGFGGGHSDSHLMLGDAVVVSAFTRVFDALCEMRERLSKWLRRSRMSLTLRPSFNQTFVS